MSILEVKDVASGYGEVQILWGASLSLGQGMITSLVGANGAGKTTLLRTIMGLVKPKSGSIIFNGQDVSTLPAHNKAELGLILVPEGRQLFVQMSVEENLEMGTAPKRAKPRKDYNLERVYTIFPRLKERRAQKARTLSGGEQQMLAVARGIMADPVVLMIDEMSLGLAPVLVLDLFQNLRKLKDEGLTILLVEQNVQMALAVSDYGFVLAHGKVDLHGLSANLIDDEHVREAYLGI
ncbi:MAG: ABC transporter ATP-binding protein [Anaerolineaceae bacterium]|nr:ABC transporter ATP-binding protein [Anaerolineaceae bacterium]